MRKDLKQRIDWYLEFAYKDLTAVGGGDLAKLAVDAWELIFSGHTGMMFTNERRKIVHMPESQKKTIFNDEWLQILQHNFNVEVFVPMMMKIDKLSEHIDLDWKTYPDSKMVNGISILGPMNISFQAELRAMGPVESDFSGNEGKYRPSRDWVKESALYFEIKPENNHQTLFNYVFIKSMLGIPTESFKKCNECQHIFLHLTKRKREFCNNLCAARSANRVRRANQKYRNPEKYESELEKGRERAGKSYENKIRKNHPKAQIKRYKKDE